MICFNNKMFALFVNVTTTAVLNSHSKGSFEIEKSCAHLEQSQQLLPHKFDSGLLTNETNVPEFLKALDFLD